MQEPNNDGAIEFNPRDLHNHLETFLPRIRAFSDVLLSGSEEYAAGTLNELGVAMREAIDETETVAIECETARLKSQKQQRRPSDTSNPSTAATGESERPGGSSSIHHKAGYICPRWWRINPGEPVTDGKYTDAISMLIERIDGLGWLMMNMQRCDADEASSVAGILIDTADEAKALQNLWLSTRARKSDDATVDAGTIEEEAA